MRLMLEKSDSGSRRSSDAHVLAAVDAVEDPGEFDFRPRVDLGGVAQRGVPVEVRAGRAIESDEVGHVLLAVRHVAPWAGGCEKLEDEEQLDRGDAHTVTLLGL